MDSASILLVSDEPNILRTLRRNLFSRGYEVEVAFDEGDVLQVLANSEYDLFVVNLDFTMKHISGLDICRKIRDCSLAPIIVLSTIGSENMKVRALDVGADDYLVMPFGMAEFLARVRSVLRRWSTYQQQQEEQETKLLIGELFIDTESHQVSLGGNEIHLTPTEYDLLLYLAAHPGKVIPHRELLRAIWGPQYGDEREYLRVFISQLRHKIEEDTLEPAYIITEPGIGYRFTRD